MRQAPPGYYVATGDTHYHIACNDCGVIVENIEPHDRWCPGKEHERMLEGYSKVFKWTEGAGE